MATRTRVLIVEDDPHVRAALCDVLTADGFAVETADNGVEAIARLESFAQPDAIVVDLLMPGIVGQELLEYLHGEPRFARVPVAVFTASPRFAPPGYPVFKKPIGTAQLQQFLRDACARLTS